MQELTQKYSEIIQLDQLQHLQQKLLNFLFTIYWIEETDQTNIIGKITTKDYCLLTYKHFKKKRGQVFYELRKSFLDWWSFDEIKILNYVKSKRMQSNWDFMKKTEAGPNTLIRILNWDKDLVFMKTLEHFLLEHFLYFSMESFL